MKGLYKDNVTEQMPEASYKYAPNVSLPSKEEIELSYRISTIIACDIAKEYAGGLATIYGEQDKHYMRNSCREAEKVCEKAILVISRDLEKLMPYTKPHVERIMSIVYDVVGMDIEKQELVHQYIKNLEK